MEILTIYEGELARPDVQQLLALHVAAMRAASPADACHVLPGAALEDPSISVFTARNGSQLVGIGALKQLDPTHGEIKSMRAHPDATGQGVGRLILDHLIATARDRGYRRISLETGSTDEFIPALRLYARAGFTICGAFGGYPATPFTRFLALDL
ncbi:GNAT family N-acetyltransferase [Sphingomonas arenae]|uniref:GNAT family N-acetyltransferase n=1 Tax=Sphingomonas arenae TaxID=2812555 RepID=UPI001966DEE1|nr:GNAT family N-acetyltransferase [Sphingomonas arenae]